MSLSDDIRTVAKGWRWARRPMVPASVEREFPTPDEFPTAWARTPAARAAREVLQRYALGPVLHFEVDVEIFGADTLKSLAPPAVFILNHSSHLDAATIVTSLPTQWRRKATVGAASDYFFDVWYRSISTTMFFNAFPIARGGGLRSARLARSLLSEGWSLVLFPEGTRTADGWVGEFRTGAAWLAMEAGVPVVPVALSGTYQAMPRGRGWPAPGRPPVRVRFGKPVWAADGERPAAFSNRLRFELGKVQEEERSGWWQSLRAEAEGELVDPSGPRVAPWRRHWETSRPVRKRWERSVWEPEKNEWMHEPLWTGTSWAPGVGELPAGVRQLAPGVSQLPPGRDVELGDLASPAVDLDLGESATPDPGEFPALDLDPGESATPDPGEFPTRLDMDLGESATPDPGEFPTRLDMDAGPGDVSRPAPGPAAGGARVADFDDGLEALGEFPLRMDAEIGDVLPPSAEAAAAGAGVPEPDDGLEALGWGELKLEFGPGPEGAPRPGQPPGPRDAPGPEETADP